MGPSGVWRVRVVSACARPSRGTPSSSAARGGEGWRLGGWVTERLGDYTVEQARPGQARPHRARPRSRGPQTHDYPPPALHPQPHPPLRARAPAAASASSAAPPGLTMLLSASRPSAKATLPRCSTAATQASTASRCSGGMPTLAIAVTVRWGGGAGGLGRWTGWAGVLKLRGLELSGAGRLPRRQGPRPRR